MDPVIAAFVVVGLALFAAAALPRVAAGRPFSAPVVAVLGGMLVFALPTGIPRPDPIAQATATEHLAELTVIVSLFGTGLKLDRPLGWRRWSTTIWLLAVAMPLFIVVTALLGAWALGLGAAGALLLGAVLSPTDPVLATEVQVGPPVYDEREQDGEDEVRFALTSEAGFNDALAFPFTAAAVLLVGGPPSEWLREWFLVDVLREIAVGLVGGIAAGRLLSWLLRRGPLRLAESREGFLGIAVTLFTYGVVEAVGGYGFLAVFVCALAGRRSERRHEFHLVLHEFVDQAERALTMVVLVLFGGAVVGGVLAPLGVRGWLLAAALVLVVRPVTAGLAVLRAPAPPGERAAIAFFGVRGIGSFFYVAWALGETSDIALDAAEVWALVSAVILLSVVVHGVTAAPLLGRLDARRERVADALR